MKCTYKMQSFESQIIIEEGSEKSVKVLSCKEGMNFYLYFSTLRLRPHVRLGRKRERERENSVNLRSTGLTR